MKRELIGQIQSKKEVEYIFCDFYDTIVHRNVHPLHTFKLWAKHLKQELALDSSSYEIFKIRRASMEFLSEKTGLFESELSYLEVIKEVHNRLECANLIRPSHHDLVNFIKCFKEADFAAENSVQYLNTKMVDTLFQLKKMGYKIFCVSDFHFDTEIMERLLKHHGIAHIYDKVFVSAAYNASKENNGILYKKILEEQQINGGQAFMIGDNLKSDVEFAQLFGIEAHYLKRKSVKINQKLRIFGSDESDFKKTLKRFEAQIKSKKYPYAQYLILFHFFIERLYHEARKNETKNLFFLAREGYFLKQLFDRYQNKFAIKGNEIKSHYLKMSRQGAMQISYLPLGEEKFRHLRSKYNHFSLRQFFKSFLFDEQTTSSIAKRLSMDVDRLIPNFFESEYFIQLQEDSIFQQLYEENRITQKENFDSYLASFNVDFDSEDMFLVDVGWGGTMQECLHVYFKGKFEVTAWYLGLQEIYNITPKTKRKGLLFSVHPNKSIKDEIMMANRQLYEQLLAAPHGSTLGYSPSPEFTIEYHKKEEKYVYDNYIKKLHEYMSMQYDSLLQVLAPRFYEEQMVSDYLFDLKLSLDLHANKNEIAFVHNLTKGFYQNIGNNNVGLDYDMGSIGLSPVQMIKQILLKPEKTYRYIVKLKPVLFRKNLYFLSLPISLYKPYLKLNFFLRDKIFKKQLLD
ncbi:HAD family hydrolase [Maribacter sp. 2304DJ31-5]|uniref:HAD family hydrolase n=1 Tax=Maribacter sp. 2304DJ31-5 TaxID=3386273 RepID=UPI0039BD6F38